MIYGHYSEAEENWRWGRYFQPREIACRGDDSLLVDSKALDILYKARSMVGQPFVITSAYRSPLHNARVGGAPKSAHKLGIAFDIRLAGHDRNILLDCCRAAGFGSFGFYKTFLHVDTRQGRSWGSWNS